MTLRRPLIDMPPDVEERLLGLRLMQAYLERPAYQRNDYLGWISRAKRTETREKRITQMLDELASGDRYMRMTYRQESQ